MKRWSPVAVVLSLVAAPIHAQLAPPNTAGMTYGHVHLNVIDVALHQRVWVEHFGGELVQRGSLSGIKYPGMIILLSGRAPTGGSMSTVMDHLGFKVRNLAPMLERWRAAGYEVQSEFTGAEGFPNAYLMGPDSVRIELQEDPSQVEEVIAYHIHFFAPDYEELLDWYVDVFGVERFQRGTIASTANAPGMNLSFGTSRTPRDPSRGRAIDHIGFEYDDLEAFVRQLEAKGIQLDSPVREVESLGLKIAFLTDPSGVYVELTEGLDEW
jgi:catechol 2,3-dioxygenase-like lactoylglutathione lyase family enzyme